jgi:hypothetical protein
LNCEKSMIVWLTFRLPKKQTGSGISDCRGA